MLWHSQHPVLILNVNSVDVRSDTVTCSFFAYTVLVDKLSMQLWCTQEFLIFKGTVSSYFSFPLSSLSPSPPSPPLLLLLSSSSCSTSPITYQHVWVGLVGFSKHSQLLYYTSFFFSSHRPRFPPTPSEMWNFPLWWNNSNMNIWHTVWTFIQLLSSYHSELRVVEAI